MGQRQMSMKIDNKESIQFPMKTVIINSPPFGLYFLYSVQHKS